MGWKLWQIHKVAGAAQSRERVLEGKHREAQADYAAKVYAAEDEHGESVAAAGDAATAVAEASGEVLVDAFNDAFDASKP